MQDYILGKNKLGYLDLWYYLKVKLDYHYTVSGEKNTLFWEKKTLSWEKEKNYSGERNIILGKRTLFWEEIKNIILEKKEHYSGKGGVSALLSPSGNAGSHVDPQQQSEL